MPEFYIDKDDKGYFLKRNYKGKQVPVDSYGQPGGLICYYETLKAIKMSCERLSRNVAPIDEISKPVKKKKEKNEDKGVSDDDI